MPEPLDDISATRGWNPTSFGWTPGLNLRSVMDCFDKQQCQPPTEEESNVSAQATANPLVLAVDYQRQTRTSRAGLHLHRVGLTSSHQTPVSNSSSPTRPKPRQRRVGHPQATTKTANRPVDKAFPEGFKSAIDIDLDRLYRDSSEEISFPADLKRSARGPHRDSSEEVPLSVTMKQSAPIDLTGTDGTAPLIGKRKRKRLTGLR